MVSKFDPAGDKEFENLARLLAVRRRQRKLKEGEEWPIEEIDPNDFYFQEQFRPTGPGFAKVDRNSDYDFLLEFADLGAGAVDLRPSRGVAQYSFTRSSTATTFGPFAAPFLSCPGIASNAAHTPSTERNSTYKNYLRVTAKIAAVDWTPSAIQTIAAKRQGTNSSWQFRLASSQGRLVVVSSPDGTGGGEITLTSTVAPTVSDGADKWVRVTYIPNNGAGLRTAVFEESDDGVTWAQLGTTVTSTATSIFKGTARMEVGSCANSSGEMFAGKIYYVQVENEAGQPVATFDARDGTSGASSIVSSATRETWTVVTSGADKAFLHTHGILSVASDVARSWYDPTTFDYCGFLREDVRNNMILQSQDLATTWTATRSTVTSNATIAPDGTFTMGKVTEDATAANTHGASQAFTYTNAVYTASFFARPGERSWVRVNLFDGTTSRGCYFNVSTGAVGTASGGTGKMTAYPNGVYRCEFTTDVAVAAAAGNYFLQLASADGLQVYDGDGASGAYFWGAQLEAASFASTYIPTTTIAVARNNEVLAYLTDAFINHNAFTLVTRGRVFASTNNMVFASMNDGGTNNMYFNRLNSSTGNMVLVVQTGGVTQVGTGSGTVAPNEDAQIASTGTTDSYAIADESGILATDSLGTMPFTTQINVGAGGNNTQGLYGTVRKVGYKRNRTANADLPALALAV